MAAEVFKALGPVGIKIHPICQRIWSNDMTWWVERFADNIP